MQEVYFSKNIEKLLEEIDYSKLGKKVAIKVHFGEKGCNTHINPKIVKQICDKIKKLGKIPTLVECNVLYKGSRTNTKEHIQTAKEHGFDFCSIDILDGENGNEFIEINGCKLGKGLAKYDSLIVLSHFKGHALAGFGGAIKNVGMGLGSRAGKLYMHSNVSPFVGVNCKGCGKCVSNCDVKAISLIKDKAKIDKKKCIGCAMCISVCPYNVIKVPWISQTPKTLQKKIAEYSKAVLTKFPDTIFINFLGNITKNCDCSPHQQTPIIQDIGFLYSKDIVAIDKASLDLVNKESKNKFKRINLINKQNQIKIAEKINLGSSEYKLINLNEN